MSFRLQEYTVQGGDTLYALSIRFGTTVERLMRENNLTSTTIYVGQTLYVPEQNLYTVQAGDTLYLIAQKRGTTAEAIIRLNRLTSVVIQPGQVLRLPLYTDATVTGDVVNVRLGPGTQNPVIVQMVRGARLPVVGGDSEWLKVRLYSGKTGWISREFVTLQVYGNERPISAVLGYYVEQEGPSLPSSQRVFMENVAQISGAGFFHFRLNREQPTEIEKFLTFTDEYLKYMVRFAHQHNIRVMPVIHNLLYERGNQEVNKIVLRGMLNTPETRQRFIANVLRLLETYGFDGAHIDFEDIYYEDRDKLTAFFRELGQALKSRGYYYAASVPSRTSDRPTNPFSAAFDYAAIGEVVDVFAVMLYNEYGWPGSGPGPAVSSPWMETVLNYAKTKMPAGKIAAAVSVFGFDFNLTTGGTAYVTWQMAMDRARRYNKEVIFDQRKQTPMFAYTDEAGNQHEVWFENQDSIRAKLLLASKMGIRAVALWRLGMEDPSIWPMIEREFVVRKSIV